MSTWTTFLVIVAFFSFSMPSPTSAAFQAAMQILTADAGDLSGNQGSRNSSANPWETPNETPNEIPSEVHKEAFSSQFKFSFVVNSLSKNQMNMHLRFDRDHGDLPEGVRQELRRPPKVLRSV